MFKPTCAGDLDVRVVTFGAEEDDTAYTRSLWLVFVI